VSSETPQPATLAEHSDLESLLQRGFRYACSLTHNDAAAEDLLQDAWVSLLKAGNVRSPGYLFRAIRCRFIDKYRRERLVVMTGLESAPGSALADARTWLGGVIANDVLARALSQLRAEEREALYLSMVEGYSAKEIAELTGRSPGAVRTMVHRIRARMREYIERDENERLTA
jgi:RNA polymerase sigma-70 factor (ECF subfamily)